MKYAFECSCEKHVLDCTCTLYICSVGICSYVSDYINIAKHLFTDHKEVCDKYKETKNRKVHEMKCKCGELGVHSHYIDFVDDIPKLDPTPPPPPLSTQQLPTHKTICPHSREFAKPNNDFCRQCITRNPGDYSGWKCAMCPQFDRIPEQHPYQHYRLHIHSAFEFRCNSKPKRKQPKPRPYCTLCEEVVEHGMKQIHEENHYKKKWCKYQSGGGMCFVASPFLLPPCRFEKLKCMNHLAATQRMISKNMRPLMNIDFIRDCRINSQLKTMNTEIETILILASTSLPNARARLTSLIEEYTMNNAPAPTSDTSYQRLPIDMWLTIAEFCDPKSRIELSHTCILLHDLFTPTITPYEWLLDHFNSIARQRSNRDVWWATNYTGVTKKDTKELFGFTDRTLHGVPFNYMSNPWNSRYGDLCIYKLTTLAQLAERQYVNVEGFKKHMSKKNNL